MVVLSIEAPGPRFERKFPVRTVRDLTDLRAVLGEWRAEGARIALVPTVIAAIGLATGRRHKLLGTALMGTAYALTRRR